MSPDRIFAQFLIESPLHRKSLVSDDNEFGVPLDPSGMHAFWQWQAMTGRMSRDVADALCESLVERFGEGVKDGGVVSWDVDVPRT